VSQSEALMRLGASTAAAVAGVLDTLVPEGISRGDVSVTTDGSTPFMSLPMPAVAAGVAYVDGASGGNIFVISVEGARQLAAAMMGQAEPETEKGSELTELELSAVAEAANQMLAAAASAISVVLGDEIEIDPPKTVMLKEAGDADEAFGTASFATSTTFGVRGESARLIQLVPNTFVARMTRALDELAAREALEGQVAGDTKPERMGLVDALRDINVRVWAELGRAQLGLGRAVSLPDGAVIELDRSAEAPVDIFVNGLAFASGELVVTDDGEWAVRVLNLNRTPADIMTMEGASL
jgi:flagellar motor switch protein FliN/FliY